MEDATVDVFPTSARILPDKIAVKGLRLRLLAPARQPTRTPQATSSYAESLARPTMFRLVIVIRGRREAALMDLDDVAHLAEALTGVRRTARGGLVEWRYHGRLVARQLDDVHLVIRADFDFRDSILRQFPETFSVPARYIKHMMVVADLAGGDAGAIEDALEAAWQLQLSAD